MSKPISNPVIEALCDDIKKHVARRDLKIRTTKGKDLDCLGKTGPAILISFGSALDFPVRILGAGNRMRVDLIIFCDDAELHVVMVAGNPHSPCTNPAAAPLAVIELADPDMLDKLTTALAKIGVQYTPTTNTKE